MPLPSYAALKKQNTMLMRQIAKLAFDENYGLTTRPGVQIELPRVQDQARHVVFLDIDDCGGANKKYGYDVVNGKIKRAMGIRHADVLLKARWFSGDELIVLLRGDPEGFIERCRASMKKSGLSATFAHVPFTGNLESDVLHAAALVQARKNGHDV